MNLTVLTQYVFFILFFVAAPMYLVVASKRIGGAKKVFWAGATLIGSWLGYWVFVLALHAAERR